MSIECSPAQIAVQPKNTCWKNVNYPVLGRQKHNPKRVVLFYEYGKGIIVQGQEKNERSYSDVWVMGMHEIVPEETGYLISNKFNK